MELFFPSIILLYYLEIQSYFYAFIKSIQYSSLLIFILPTHIFSFHSNFNTKCPFSEQISNIYSLILLRFKMRIVKQNQFISHMPRFTIIEQPLEGETLSRSRRQKVQQSPLYVHRLRQVLENNRKNSVYEPREDKYIFTRNKSVKDYIPQIQDTEKSANEEEEVLYVVKDERQKNSPVRLPKLKKKHKVAKYSDIDKNDKMIIKNYMNAKLIQFKQPKKRKKKKNSTIDYVNQLPNSGNKRYYVYKKNTPVDSLAKFLIEQHNNSKQPSQRNITTPKSSKYYSDNFKIRQYSTDSLEIAPRERRAVSKIVKTQGQLNPSYSYNQSQYNNLNNHDESNRMVQSNIKQISKINEEEEGWELVDPLNLETYFIKLKRIGNNTPNLGRMVNREKIKIPEIPTRDKMSSFIKQYTPECKEIKMEELIKSDTFQIIQDQSYGKHQFYFGETKDDKKHGRGIQVTKTSLFEGIWDEDEKVKGVQKNEQGKYKGQFKEGKRNGKGEFYWNNGQYYEGEWKNGKKHGSGYWRSEKGESYMGEWSNGQVTGYGVHTMKTGQKYQGQFISFLKHGYGRQTFPNGDIYEGRYSNGQPHGKGKYFWKNGTIFEGQFVQGFRQGKGIITAPNRLQFQGTFKNEIITGLGHLKMSNGDVYNGMLENNKKNGHGVLDIKSQRRIIKGIWLDNELLKQQL